MSYGIKLHIWGDFACFTRPEMKAERVSYDITTPSAARGVSSKPSIGNPRSAGSSTKST
ncbi:MAG: CRISPR-associated Cas5-like protein [Akkermansiaceae bacterium]|jgi:CRISPR-associated Cas5-like protein